MLSDRVKNKGRFVVNLVLTVTLMLSAGLSIAVADEDEFTTDFMLDDFK